MLYARELAALAQGLDATAFERQMGPFALMQRPAPDERAEQALKVGAGRTALQPALRLKGAPDAVDFGDLWVATLPPPGADGQLELIIGRAPDCDLVVDDDAVSKRHAVIRWRKDEGLLTELGSSNGTFINGHRLKDFWPLKDGNQVGVGRSHFIYLLAATLHRRLRSLR